MKREIKNLNNKQRKLFSSLIEKFLFPFLYIEPGEKNQVKYAKKNNEFEGQLGISICNRKFNTLLNANDFEFIVMNPHLVIGIESLQPKTLIFDYIFYIKNPSYGSPTQFHIAKAKDILYAITQAFVFYINNPGLHRNELDALCTSMIETTIIKSLFKQYTKVNSENIIKLFSTIKEISLKTNEGNNISLAFTFNFNCQDKAIENYLKFLTTTPAASVISNDSNCYIYFEEDKYNIKTTPATPFCAPSSNNNDEEKDEKPPKPIFLPDKLSGFKELCFQKKISFVLTENGDILILGKNGIEFAFRYGQCQPYDFTTFRNLFNYLPILLSPTDDEELDLLRDIYQTVLDVAFSRHGGGLVICTEDVAHKMIIDGHLLEKDIVNKKFKKDITDKRALSFIELVKSNDFFNLHPEIRKELINIDGSVVITTSGELVAIGSILQKLDTSEGGARSSAMKGISEKYDACVAIKISEDGYVVVYRKGESKYKLK